jgi:histidyl-tRNA synthetase
MALSKAPYKGTRDFFPEQMRLRNYIFSKMAEVSELFAYEPYDGPMIEELDLYRAKSGEELINDQVYNFVDRGDREVAIRPEMTPTVARMVAQIHREVAKPLRWYAIPNLMRYEKPQKGRLREFWQYNADIFGAPEGLGELEGLQLAVGILKSFGANENNFEILINDRKMVDTIFTEVLKLEPDAAAALYKIVDRSKKVPADKTKEDAKKILITDEKTDFFTSYLALTNVADLSNLIVKYNSVSIAEMGIQDNPLYKLSLRIHEAGLSPYIKYDPTIVRGLDYYTGLVFEIFDKHPDNRRAIAGGGAFANLLAIFGEQPLAGIGFGMGEVPLTDFLKAHGLLPDTSKQHIDLLIAYENVAQEKTALDIAQVMRSHKIKVEVYLGESKPKKVFSYTDKKQPHFVLLLGDEVQLKNLKTKETHKMALADVDNMINVIKGSR